MISVEGIGKRFGKIWALRNLSFEVQPGERVGFVGPNGAGKTTALRILSGYFRSDEGTASVVGFDLASERPRACANLGYMPDTAPLPSDMRVSEFLRFRARLKGIVGDKVEEQLAGVLIDLELEDVEGRLISRLSRGYRQRVALADALIADPKVLLLDEPTTGLDPLQRRAFRELLLRHSERRSVLFSSHQLGEVEAIAQRFLVVRGGCLVASGDLAALRAQAELSGEASAEDIFAKLVSEG